jgi:hypothetical protein
MNKRKLNRIHKEIKKANLKPIELKSKNKKENIEEKKEEKKEEKSNQQAEEEESGSRDDSFHENILQESIDFAKPILENESESINQTLEETASNISLTTNHEDNTNPSIYQTSTYDVNKPQDDDLSQKYRTSSSLNSSFTDSGDRNSSRSNPWNNSGQEGDEFQNLQEQYRTEREDTTLPFEQRRRRSGIW